MLLIAILLSGVTVTVRERANVRGAEITVADVADVAGSDAAIVERVRKASLGYAPAPGFSRWLDAQRIDGELERALGIAIDVTGATGCRAWPAVTRVEAVAIEAAARGELERWTRGREAVVALTGSVAGVEIPAGNSAFELRAELATPELRAGAVNVPVRVLVDGAQHRTVWTSWNVELWELASVPVRAIRAGEVLSADLFVTQRVRASNTPSASVEELFGSAAANDLPAGEPVRLAQLARPTLVQAGAPLTLEVRRGAITARVTVVADQPAKRGERIRVSQPGTQRTWQAQVHSRDLAVIELVQPNTQQQ